MSERVIRQVSVIEKSDGSAVIERVDGHLDEVTATGTVLEIPAEDRAAVALALLGGMTDHLIERCARAIGPDDYDRLHPEARRLLRDMAETMLEATFGVAQP